MSSFHKKESTGGLWRMEWMIRKQGLCLMIKVSSSHVSVLLQYGLFLSFSIEFFEPLPSMYATFWCWYLLVPGKAQSSVCIFCVYCCIIHSYLSWGKHEALSIFGVFWLRLDGLALQSKWLACFSMFSSFTFLGFLYCSTVQPGVAIEQTIFSRILTIIMFYVSRKKSGSKCNVVHWMVDEENLYFQDISQNKVHVTEMTGSLGETLDFYTRWQVVESRFGMSTANLT